MHDKSTHKCWTPPPTATVKLHSNESSELYAIKSLLESNNISHLNLLNFTNTSSEQNIKLDHVVLLLEHVDYFNKLFNNKNSKEYIVDIHQRMDKLRQYVCQWLIQHHYEEFWIAEDIPVALECFIRNSNTLEVEINDILAERIRDAAKEQKKSYQEVIDEIMTKYYDK